MPLRLLRAPRECVSRLLMCRWGDGAVPASSSQAENTRTHQVNNSLHKREKRTILAHKTKFQEVNDSNITVTHLAATS
jgi:hypothetical protein